MSIPAIPSKSAFLAEWKLESANQLPSLYGPFDLLQSLNEEVTFPKDFNVWSPFNLKYRVKELVKITEEVEKADWKEPASAILRSLFTAALLVGAIAAAIFMGPVSIPLFLLYFVMSTWNFIKAGGEINEGIAGLCLVGPFIPIFEIIVNAYDRNPSRFAKEHEELKKERHELALFFKEHGEEISKNLQDQLDKLNEVQINNPEINNTRQQLNSLIAMINHGREYYSQFYGES